MYNAAWNSLTTSCGCLLFVARNKVLVAEYKKCFIKKADFII